MDTNHPESSFTVGQRVNHPAWDAGTITDVNGDKITVSFDSGEIHMIKAYALEASNAEVCTDSVQNHELSTNAVEDLIESLIEQCRECYVRGAEWRVAMGEKLFKLRAAIKAAGTRDFTETIEQRLGMKRQTAYDYIWEYEVAGGQMEQAVTGTDQPNPLADAIVGTIAAELEKREGLEQVAPGANSDSTADTPDTPPASTQPPAPQSDVKLDQHVKISLPKIHVTADDEDAYKAALKKNREYVVVQFRTTFYAILTHFAAQATTEVVDEVTESVVDAATFTDEPTDAVTESDSDSADYVTDDNDLPSSLFNESEGYTDAGAGA
jgi:hypothetical protein